jgi:hypothetical protein
VCQAAGQRSREPCALTALPFPQAVGRPEHRPFHASGLGSGAVIIGGPAVGQLSPAEAPALWLRGEPSDLRDHWGDGQTIGKVVKSSRGSGYRLLQSLPTGPRIAAQWSGPSRRRAANRRRLQRRRRRERQGGPPRGWPGAAGLPSESDRQPPPSESVSARTPEDDRGCDSESDLDSGRWSRFKFCEAAAAAAERACACRSELLPVAAAIGAAGNGPRAAAPPRAGWRAARPGRWRAHRRRRRRRRRRRSDRPRRCRAAAATGWAVTVSRRRGHGHESR